MIWHFLKHWTSLILPVFYKRIQGHNIKNLRVNGPVIVAMNHPNAFTDPVVITQVAYPPRLKYMARGDAFKPGLITWLLEAIGIVPIYRIQDGGREGLQKNDDAYRRVNAFLKHNHKVIIFAEGLCVQERRLRPLKKGVARMVFGAYDFLGHDKLTVVPVGVNYSKPDKFRSNILYNVGEPIYVRDYIKEYQQNPARTYNKFLEELASQMKGLITHIDDPANDEAVYMLEKLLKKDLIKQKGLNYSDLSHQLLVLKEITSRVNQAAKNQNPALSEFKTTAGEYFDLLNKHGLRDWLVNPLQNKWVNYPMLLFRGAILLAGLPLYAFGLLGNLLPMILTDHFARKINNKPEFYSSFAIALAMVFMLINYLLWFFIPYAFSQSVFPPLILCNLLIFGGVFSLWYHPFLLKALGLARFLKNTELAKALKMKREYILSLVNKF